MTPYGFLLALLLVPLPMHSGLAFAASQPPQANPIGTAVLGFKERVAEYLKLHREAASKAPKLISTNDAATVLRQEVELAAMIKKLRPDAKEGDIFTDAFRTVLAREVRRDFLRRSAADRNALMLEPPKNMKIAVNMTYPIDKALGTFPGQLLQKLPELPPELEYRIVGHHIVLRDVAANIIVDIARNIIPVIVD